MKIRCKFELNEDLNDAFKRGYWVGWDSLVDVCYFLLQTSSPKVLGNWMSADKVSYGTLVDETEQKHTDH